MHRTILVAATPDDAGREAFALAVALARPIGAQVVLGAVEEVHGGIPSRGADGLDALLAGLEPLRENAPPDVPVSVDGTRSRSVAHGLHDLATKLDAQLLVLGPSHRGTISRALHGDTAAGTVFRASCGVAVAVGPHTGHAPQRIGVAWDGTPEADEALEWAVQLAERTAGTVQLIQVGEPRHPEDRPLRKDSGQLLETMRQGIERRAPATTKLLWGDAGPQLIEASHGLDLLVLGSRARGALRRTLFGSVSHEVLHGAHCPVVVLPHGVHALVDTAAV